MAIHFLIPLLIIATSIPAFAQQPQQAAPTDHQHQHEAETSTVLFPAREASGTAWLPDDTPMYAVHRRLGPWDVMLHGVAFAELLFEPGDIHRTGGFSGHQFASVNWGMAMARRPLGQGRFGLRAMASLEPWTVGDCGFLDLLATGEMCEGDTIHDRQHPHDLFMELSADYDRPLHGSLRWQIYGGFAGEPALGPAGFPHRISAMANPIAPIAHHWLDSTHITYGLITTGIYDRRWKAEMSVFNGREPDENRADVDLGALDSFSARLAISPTSHLSLQISAAHLHESEAEFPPNPRSDLNRATASATYHRPLGGDGIWATTLGWGLNSGQEIIPEGLFDATTQAVLVESSVTLHDRHTWFSRAEVVEKPAHDLHAHEYPDSVFTVGKLQGGYTHYMRPWHGLSAGIGATVSISLVPSELSAQYHGRVIPGFGIFLNLRPSRHAM